MLDAKALIYAYLALGRVILHGERIAHVTCGTCRTVYGYKYWFLAHVAGILTLFVLAFLVLRVPVRDLYSGQNAYVLYAQAALGVATLIGVMALVSALFARCWPLRRCRQA